MPSKKDTAIKEIFEKMQQTKENEQTRIQARRKAQKKGKSIATKKNTKPKKKPIREGRKVTKKRSSIR